MGRIALDNKKNGKEIRDMIYNCDITKSNRSPISSNIPNAAQIHNGSKKCFKIIGISLPPHKV